MFRSEVRLTSLRNMRNPLFLNEALFLNRPNNVSTAVPDEYVCLSAIDALFIKFFYFF